MPNDKLLTRKEAAVYLQEKGCATSARTLYMMSQNGNADRGPSYLVYKHKKRRHIRYERTDLDSWAAKHLKRVE